MLKTRVLGGGGVRSPRSGVSPTIMGLQTGNLAIPGKGDHFGILVKSHFDALVSAFGTSPLGFSKHFGKQKKTFFKFKSQVFETFLVQKQVSLLQITYIHQGLDSDVVNESTIMAPKDQYKKNSNKILCDNKEDWIGAK